MSFLMRCTCSCPFEHSTHDEEESTQNQIQHIYCHQNQENTYEPLLESIPLLVKESRMITYEPDASQYEFQGLLGFGCKGAAVISQVKHKLTGHILAIKRINLEDSNVDLSSLQYEAVLMRQLHHANILPYFCTFITTREMWSVMPHMHYGSVQDLINQTFVQGIPELIIAFILYDVLNALTYIHKRGLIHRGLRASHIVISNKGRACLTGFQYSCSMIMNGKFMKSVFSYSPDIQPNLNWLSPEVLEQNLEGYMANSDVYSIGIVACEMANGVVPFAHMPPTQMLLEKVRGATPVLLDSSTCQPPEESAEQPNEVDEFPAYFREKSFSDSFHQFVGICLKREPNLRPTASQLVKHVFFKQCFKSSTSLSELLHDFVHPEDVNTTMVPDNIVDNAADQMDNLTLDADNDWNF